MKVRIITSKEVSPYKPVNTDAAKSIITTELKDKVKVIDVKKGDYVIEQVAEVTSKIDTQEYIDSFAGDVGIENILKKFQLVKDESLFQQVKRPGVSVDPLDKEGREKVQDYSGIPSDEESAIRLASKAQAEFARLPQELVKGCSFNEFAETCTKEELITFLASVQNVEKKEGEVK